MVDRVVDRLERKETLIEVDKGWEGSHRTRAGGSLER